MTPAKKSTLLILIPGFPKDELDSTCLPAQQQFIRCFNQYFPEIDIEIFSFQYPFETGEYKWHGNRVTAFGGRNKGGIKRFLLREKIKTGFARLKEQTLIVGILSFWAGETALIGNYFSKKYSIPHFTWLMGQDARTDNTYIKKINPVGSEIIAISDSIQSLFTDNFGIRPAHMVPLGINKLEEPANNLHRDIDILCAGSLITLKQFELAIDTIHSLKPNYPALKVMICGEGPERNKLQARIHQYGLSNTITMTGEMPYRELMHIMARARILLHPSAYEGFSGVCLEALSHGMDVVSFCKPMNNSLPNWHIVPTIDEMTHTTDQLLQTKKSYHPVLPFTMKGTVNAIANLFDIKGSILRFSTINNCRSH